MGLKIAVANGNWSNPATWNGGLLPKVGDVVASNNFTVTIDQNINVSLLTNTAQTGVSAVPVMTSATTPSGIVTSSGNYDAARAAWNAFAASGIWISGGGSFPPQWIAYEFTSPKIIGSYSFNSGWALSAMPKDFLFQGWDGSSWVTLHTVTGNTNTTYTSPSIGNTTAYIAYRFYTTAINQTNPAGDQFVSMAAIKMFESGDFSGSSVAGGGFVLTNGVTVNCTTALRSGNTTLLLWSGTTGNTITSPSAVGAGSGRLIDVAGTGTLNINITTITGVGGVAPTLVHIGAAATVNIVGTFQAVSDLRGTMLNIAAAATVNVTGNLIRNIYTNNTFYMVAIVAANSTLNITGDIIVGNIANYWGYDWNITAVYNINITGSLQTISVPSGDQTSIFSNIAGYFKVIGPIITYGNHVVYRNTNSSAINIFSGPFVCSTYGYVPLQVTRMHLIPTTNSYFEFRDETTNGALSPGAIAPATQLVSPASVSDGPAVEDVRLGTVYALGTLIGTLNMPHPNQVTYGVAVDNTFGNAVLTAASVWDYLVANITVENSIGMRLKNVSTPQTTGEQLEAFLRLE